MEQRSIQGAHFNVTPDKIKLFELKAFLEEKQWVVGKNYGNIKDPRYEPQRIDPYNVLEDILYAIAIDRAYLRVNHIKTLVMSNRCAAMLFLSGRLKLEHFQQAVEIDVAGDAWLKAGDKLPRRQNDKKPHTFYKNMLGKGGTYHLIKLPKTPISIYNVNIAIFNELDMPHLWLATVDVNGMLL